MFITRAIAATNLCVATSALGFQMFVLYPWHLDFNDDIHALKMENVKLLPGAAKKATDSAGTGTSEGGVRRWLSGFGRSGSPTSKELASHSYALPGAVADIPQHVHKPVVAKSWYNAEAVSLYSKFALAGGICCSFTHAIVTPIDIVKTRIQVDPSYKGGIFRGLQQATAAEGVGALTTGLGPTVVGYFLQGALKFGGYEFFKGQALDFFGPETASKNRYAIYLGASALAEMAGDLLLCPFEAVRIRLVSQPGFGHGLWDGFARLVREEGMRGLYSGLGPILFKQVPYTMTQFVVFENAIEQIYKVVDRSTVSGAAVTGINIGAGLLAGLVSAVVSQPADTILSKISKEKGKEGEGIMRRVWNVAKDTGVRGSFIGMRARLVMVGGMTAMQFTVYGDIKKAVGATSGMEIE